MVGQVRAPNLLGAYTAGIQGAQSERLAEQQNMRQNALADLQREQLDWRREADERDFDFRVEGRDFQRQQQEAAAARAARNAAAAERAGLQRAELERIGQVLEYARGLPEGERFGTLSRFIDPRELTPYLIGPEANPILSDRVIDEMMLGYGMAPPQPAAPDWDVLDGMYYDANNPAAGARPLPGMPPPTPERGYRMMAPEEVAATPGLDPSRAYQIGPKGQIAAIGGGGVNVTVEAPDPNFSPSTEGERLAGGFLLRMNNAERILGEFYGDGYTNPNALRRAGTAVMPESWVLDTDDLRVLQAQRDWVRAKLRKESGAVIGDAEMADEIKTYFPQPGDGPQVAAQKAQARQVAMQGMSIAAGLPAPLSMFNADDEDGGAVINGQRVPAGTRLRVGGVEGVVEGGAFRAGDGTLYDLTTGAPIPGR